MREWAPSTLVAVLAAALLAGCGAGGGGAPPEGAARLPDTRVQDLAGRTLPLSSLVPARRPVLLWVWGPG